MILNFSFIAFSVFFFYNTYGLLFQSGKIHFVYLVKIKSFSDQDTDFMMPQRGSR